LLSQKGITGLAILAATLTLLLSGSLLAVVTEDELTNLSKRGRQAMASGQFQEAEEAYARLNQLVPGNAGLLVNLAIALHYEGKYKESIAACTAALQVQHDLAVAEFFLGINHVKLHHPASALPPLRAAVKADPSNGTFLLELADALLATNAFQEASAEFAKLLELHPKDARGWHGLGLSYVGQSQQCFRLLESKAPNSPYILLLLADSDIQQEQYRSAFSLLKKALSQNGTLPGVHSNLAEIYSRIGHPEWAAVEQERERASASDCTAQSDECNFLAGRYQAVIAAPGTTPSSLYWKTRSYETLALKAFAQLAQLPPTPQIHELMADAYRTRGQNHQAVHELREAIQLSPKDMRLQALYATALWRDHDYTTAQPLLEKLVEADPNAVDLNFELGDLYLEQEEPEKALPLLKRAVERDSSLLPAQALLARAYVALDQPSAAIKHFQAALTLDEDGSLHRQLAKAYEQAGQPALGQKARLESEKLARAHASTQDLQGNNAEISPP
jgi:tetratricopeptide (TPR) repeat protein